MTEPAKTPAPEPTEADRQAAAVAAANAHRQSVANAAQPDPPPPVAHTRPEGVPEKFWNKDTGAIDYKAWGEAHKSLETKFHQQQPPAADPPKPGEPPADERTAAVNAASQEFSTSGKLSDATYATLEKQGYTRAMVDGYIAGQTARSSSLANAAYEPVGGAEQYNAMIAWAAENLSEPEIKAYNAQLATNDPAVIKAAAAAVHAKFKANAPVEGTRVGGNPPAASGQMFQSKAEMTAAQRVPSPTHPGKTRYETDAVYRNEVIAKIHASRKAGINIFI